MAQAANSIDIYLEAGQKRTFAAALDWPGWCRSWRDKSSALQALVDYGPRYARVLEGAQLDFNAPKDVSALVVVERQAGNATTDFGAPDRTLPGDTKPVDLAELQKWQHILNACWRAFDAAVESAAGKTLSKGPRGGGRDLAKIVEHVRDVNASYLSSLGGKLELERQTAPDEALAHIRQAILNTLDGAVSGEIPPRGPRGGVRWTPRYFVRRLAWHELDHAWEIEDRVG